MIDPVGYKTWGQFGKDIVFVKASVEEADVVFGQQKFDLIFCNRVFHHFVTKGYKNTLKMMESSMKKIQGILSPDGCICVADILYDGFIFDQFPSISIFYFTSVRNPYLVSLFRKLGARSAGSGVCFQSEKMWRHFLAKCGLRIEKFEKGPVSPINLFMQMAFLTHNPIDKSIFICSNSKKVK